MNTITDKHVPEHTITIDGEAWIRAYGGEIRQPGRLFRLHVPVTVAGMHKGYGPAVTVCRVQPDGCGFTYGAHGRGLLFGSQPVWVRA